MKSYIVFGIISFFVLLIGILIFTRKGSNKDTLNEEQGKNEKKKSDKVGKTVAELIPLADYDLEQHCYRMKDNTYLDIMQLNTKDLLTSSRDEVEYDCLKFAKLYKLYEDDLKIIAMNFPCNTKRQQQHIQRRIQKTSNPIYRQALQKDLEELIWLEKHNTTREFYFLIYGESVEAIEKNRATIKTVLHTGRDGLIMEIPDEKKEQIWIRLNNKNLLMRTS